MECFEELFRRYVELAPDACLFVDLDGNIAFANSQAESLFGYRSDEMVGQSVLMLIPGRYHDRVPVPNTARWDTARRSLPLRGLAAFACGRDSVEFPAEVSLTPIHAQGVEVVAVTVRDIRGQVQSQEQLLQHLSDLAHVSRLSTMGEMVAGLAHELNQPLYAISNYAQACQQLVVNYPDLHQDVSLVANKLMSQTYRAAEIVRRMRRFVSRRSPSRSPVDINSLVREVQQLMLFNAHRFSITVKLVLAPELPLVIGDSILLEQVLVNLLRNAFEAMSEDTLSERAVTVETSVAGDDMVAVTVSDTGPGFGEVTEDQLFEAFYTTKDQGMGLGLVISRSIVEAHGGRLSAISGNRRGASFRMTLPKFVDSHG